LQLLLLSLTVLALSQTTGLRFLLQLQGKTVVESGRRCNPERLCDGSPESNRSPKFGATLPSSN